ncbi:ATP-binding protein [Peptostreptococcus anaerobius]|uniref:ATP-binding protein n=1 Tax=Peptostreptococcus anaerobius TaxID=1261 RepID=UPI0023314E0A|nr:ATP-binding protein [Peptostreptococcus anaerobius]MDB8821905.1 ATP-binding protein [Peptostreptococcus anaerobius]MDB8826493.1 ATP-binding protein [Peptostreptococcus anaerobius]MDB8828400.1 ATP-binding protein [Peptostreptococcus anaerobius]MDB8830201.1 ATP-binding protein [Peptostreptococcus anaerobius]MDB8832028.1 ATP-binding protein [Peptostreptococcus anaerobius]
MNNKRIRIITGHYGSGKSEFSVNYALKLRGEIEGRLAISDLDVVNVYFRSRGMKDLLEEKGIHVIASSVDAPTLDIPALSAEIHTPLLNKDYNNIIDLGGDKVGATVIARYRDMINDEDYDMFFVVNANREKTQTAEEVMGYIDEIEAASKLKVTGLINNTHMLKATTIEDLEKGQEVCREVSKARNIPIKFVSCMESLVDQIPEDFEGEIIPLSLMLRDQWMM